MTPEIFELLGGFLMFCGLSFWVSLTLSHKSNARLLEGAGWLDWRPLPHDMGVILMWGFGLSYLVRIMVFALIPDLLTFPNSLQIAISLLLYQGLLVAMVYRHLARVRIPETVALGMGKGHWWHDFSWGLVGYAMVIPVIWVASLISTGLFWVWGWEFKPQEMVTQIQQEGGMLNSLLIWVLVGFVGPFLEEVIFRGVLFPILVRRCGLWLGLTLHAMLFGLIHLHAESVIPLTALAVILGLQYMYTRRLMTCVWTHAFFNSMTLLMNLPIFQAGGGG